jgi:phosphatidylserine/phosphatidylglycerophosphate/cardiolipin synthase-like enzyme
VGLHGKAPLFIACWKKRDMHFMIEIPYALHRYRYPFRSISHVLSYARRLRMNRHSINPLTVLFSALFILSLTPMTQAETLKTTGTVDSYFSPKGGCTAAVVKEIKNAKTEILVQAYSFASKPIARTLVDAKKRGVQIEIVLDKSIRSKKHSSVDFLAHEGVPVWIDDKHAVAHNKVMIIDRETLITGSFNFKKKAEKKNAENLLVLKGNKPLVDRYIQNFNEHKGHSEVYQADN